MSAGWHEAVLPLLGVPVRLRCDAPEPLAAFEASLGHWRALDARPELLSAVGVEGRIVLRSGDEGPRRPPPVTYTLPDDRQLRVATPGSHGLADPRRRAFHAEVTRSLVADRNHFVSAVLESLILAVVTWMDRQPLHACAVARGDAALLLCGPSGRGKSTLAYAAARAGLAVLADDAAFIQTRPLRVWGRPGRLHLPPDAGRHFPELAGVRPRRVANGKEKVVVELAALDATPALPVAGRAGVCLLERGVADVPCWERLDAAQLERGVLSCLEPGFDRFRDTLAGPLGALSRGGAWRLRVGPRPEAALPALHFLLDEVESAPGATHTS